MSRRGVSDDDWRQVPLADIVGTQAWTAALLRIENRTGTALDDERFHLMSNTGSRKAARLLSIVADNPSVGCGTSGEAIGTGCIGKEDG